MTDHDPLAGRDPYPREQIDLVGLRERQELLEEIVSEPSQSPPTRRFLLPVGIAAALAIVAGGAWFVTTGADDTGDDPTVAASSETTVGETATDDAPTADPTEPDDATPTTPTTERVRVRDLERGDVIPAKQCRELLRADRGEARRTGLDVVLKKVRRWPREVSRVVYLMHPGVLLAVDGDCTVVDVERDRRTGLRLEPRRG